MKQAESIIDFYKRSFQKETNCEDICKPGIGHINVFSRDYCSHVSPYNRRDYYKISLIIGTGNLQYADQWIYIDRPALLFSNPLVPYSWEAESEEQSGWFTLFSKEFVEGNNLGFNIQETPFYKTSDKPIYFLEEEQVELISLLFERMIEELKSDYTHKYSVLRSYLQLLIHEAMKIEPAKNFEVQHNASQRVTTLFIELLERQFPVDPVHSLQLKTASHFSENLNVHSNSLNRAVKEITGQTTSDLISGRIIQEAKALLQNTNWNINEIAFSLGFDEAAYFTNYFKKKLGYSPIQFRQGVI